MRRGAALQVSLLRLLQQGQDQRPKASRAEAQGTEDLHRRRRPRRNDQAQWPRSQTRPSLHVWQGSRETTRYPLFAAK